MPHEATKDLADGQVDVRAIGLERQELGFAQTHMHDFLSGGSLCHRLLPLPLFSPGRGLATAGRASSPASGTVQFSYHANCYPANQILTLSILFQWLKWLYGLWWPRWQKWLIWLIWTVWPIRTPIHHGPKWSFRRTGHRWSSWLLGPSWRLRHFDHRGQKWLARAQWQS